MTTALLIISAALLSWAIVGRDVATLRERPSPRWSRTPVLLGLGLLAAASFVLTSA